MSRVAQHIDACHRLAVPSKIHRAKSAARLAKPTAWPLGIPPSALRLRHRIDAVPVTPSHALLRWMVLRHYDTFPRESSSNCSRIAGHQAPPNWQDRFAGRIPLIVVLGRLVMRQRPSCRPYLLVPECLGCVCRPFWVTTQRTCCKSSESAELFVTVAGSLPSLG